MKIILFWCRIGFQAFQLLGFCNLAETQTLTSINSNQQLIFSLPNPYSTLAGRGHSPHNSYTGLRVSEQDALSCMPGTLYMFISVL